MAQVMLHSGMKVYVFSTDQTQAFIELKTIKGVSQSDYRGDPLRYEMLDGTFYDKEYIAIDKNELCQIVRWYLN